MWGLLHILDNCLPVAVDYETFHHHVVLNTLEPDTTYYYVVGDDSNGYSNEFKFTSAPLSSRDMKNFTFAVFGDLGKRVRSTVCNVDVVSINRRDQWRFLDQLSSLHQG
jgi:hypothetical protein